MDELWDLNTRLEIINQLKDYLQLYLFKGTDFQKMVLISYLT